MNKDMKKYGNSKDIPPISLSVDAISLMQKLRIRIWKIIARNNSETLSDPLLRPLEKPMPYVQKADKKDSEDNSQIKPTLDEVLPLPAAKDKAKKQEAKPAPKEPKKTSAKDLISDEEDENQMTLDEALEQAKTKSQQKETVPTETAQANTSKQENAKPTPQSEKQPERKLTLREKYYIWKRDRADHKDYFDQLEVQIKNKNAACFELLNYLDELEKADVTHAGK